MGDKEARLPSLALNIEEGAASQQMQDAEQAGKDTERVPPLQPPEEEIAH